MSSISELGAVGIPSPRSSVSKNKTRLHRPRPRPTTAPASKSSIHRHPPPSTGRRGASAGSNRLSTARQHRPRRRCRRYHRHRHRHRRHHRPPRHPLLLPGHRRQRHLLHRHPPAATCSRPTSSPRLTSASSPRRQNKSLARSSALAHHSLTLLSRATPPRPVAMRGRPSEVRAVPRTHPRC